MQNQKKHQTGQIRSEFASQSRCVTVAPTTPRVVIVVFIYQIHFLNGGQRLLFVSGFDGVVFQIQRSHNSQLNTRNLG